MRKALYLFWQEGYSQTSIRDLERSLEISAPSIYNTFGNKEKLFLMVLEYYNQNIVNTRVVEFLGRSSDPLADLEIFFLTAVDPDDPEKQRWGCLLTNTATELPWAGTEITRLIKTGLDLIKRAFSDELLRAQEKGLLNTNRDVLLGASELLISYEGLLVMARLGYSSSTLKLYVNNIINHYR